MGVLNLLSKPLVGWLNKQVGPPPAPLSDYGRICYELKPCDVLLIEGRSRASEVIKVITQSCWSHAALYVGRLHDVEDPELRKIVTHHYNGEPEDRLIIESLLGEGTIVRNLETYKDDHLRICRPSRLSIKDSQQVIRYAISRLGLDYDVRHIFDLARFMFPWTILPRRWRSSLFRKRPGRPTRTVCSTMIAEAFAFVQFPILPLIKLTEGTDGDDVQIFRRNPKLCVPSDFDQSPYFDIIKYPFVDFSAGKDYHLLPWHGPDDLTDKDSDLYRDVDHGPSVEDVDEAIEEAIQTTEHADDPESESESESEPDPESRDDKPLP